MPPKSSVGKQTPSATGLEPDISLVAVLRGITPEQAEAVADTLLDVGFHTLEVPLNSPHPRVSIKKLARRYDPSQPANRHVLIGAGTVLSRADADNAIASGARLIVSPHTDVKLIAHVKSHGVWCIPGAFTPTEAITALASGADALKLFPAQALNVEAVAALRAVLPATARLILIGGVTPTTIRQWQNARPGLIDGWGIGSQLFTAQMSLAELRSRAKEYVAAVRGN